MAVNLHKIVSARDFFPDVVLVLKMIAALIHKAQMYRFPNIDAAFVGLFLAGNHLEQR